MKFSTGYLPDPISVRRAPFHHLAARLGSDTLPPSASLFPGAPPVMDQSATGSCTGHASACALFVAVDMPWIASPAEIYRNGRAIDRMHHADGSFDPLGDDGAEPNQVVRAINLFGVRPMVPLASRFSDADPKTINHEPMLGDLEAEAITMFVGDYGIFTSGIKRLDDICTSIANGKPVTVAIAGGSDAFQSYGGGVIRSLGTDLDHYVTLLSYETLTDGSRVFGGQNSWGEGWGEAGRFRLSETAVGELGDLIAFDVRRSA